MFTGKLNTSFFGIGVVEIQLFVSCLYFLKAYYKTDFGVKAIGEYNFFDMIFYPLFVGLILLSISKYLKFYKVSL